MDNEIPRSGLPLRRAAPATTAGAALSRLVRHVQGQRAMDTDILGHISVALNDLRQELLHLEDDLGAGNRQGAVHRAHRAEITVRRIRGTLGDSRASLS